MPAGGAALSSLVDAKVVSGMGTGLVPTRAHCVGLQCTVFRTLKAAAGGGRVSLRMDRDPYVLRETDTQGSVNGTDSRASWSVQAPSEAL